MKNFKVIFGAILFSSFSYGQLPVINAKINGKKLVSWGLRPVESNDGPAEQWTMPNQMCEGPERGNVKASTTLSSQGKSKYLASYVCDDDPTTAWVESSSDYGIGEFLEINNWQILGGNVRELSILNGYQSSKTAWQNNSRVKKFKVSLNGKDICILDLADVMGVQTFKLPAKWARGNFRFTIVEVYKGDKYKDTAISGMFSCGG
ncbi:hypothetical protein SAMN05444372_103265 [Flavobacterium micromati]|uniref:NAD glycohydrolase translocation F5/8 type C domain-containing protein n=1 Tax=Flavobacterium micromati TaxID=229205 RepID=A0A1M5I3V2_9FLAO|nr:hypothetical protein [Flavobacterium micromati]SHG22817.1 hypothetical protein SAMN05444372_103265 [Flavobacterium micromati]